MKPSLLDEKIKQLEKPSLGDSLGHAHRWLREFWNEPGYLDQGKKHILRLLEGYRQKIAHTCRGVDAWTYIPIKQGIINILGNSLEENAGETKNRKKMLEELIPQRPKHPEEKRKKAMEPQLNRSKNILAEIEKIEKNDDLLKDASTWFQKRFTEGLNRVREKYGTGRKLDLFERNPSDGRKAYNTSKTEYEAHLRLDNHAKVLAHQAIKQESNSPSKLPQLEYVYRPPVESNDTDTTESFEARNQEYWKERKEFGFEQIVFQGKDFDTLLYDADKYLSEMLGSDYNKLNRDGMSTLHIATAERGEKKAVVIILTGKEDEGTPEEDVVKNNQALEEMESVTSPPDTNTFFKGWYESIKDKSVIAQYIMEHLKSPYAASVVYELEKAVRKKYNTEIEKGDVLNNYKVLGSPTGSDAIELSIPLPGRSNRKFVITEAGLIVTKPQNTGQKSQDSSSAWGSGNDSIMSWKELYHDLTPEGEAEHVYKPTAQEGLKRFPLEKGSYEKKADLLELNEQADKDDADGFQIPFGKRVDGVKEIMIKNVGNGKTQKLKIQTKSGKNKGKYVIAQEDVADLLTTGKNTVELSITLKGGQTFKIPNVIINRVN